MRNQTLAENFADALPVLAFVTNRDGESTFSNEPFRAFCGKTNRELLGRHWSEVLHPDDRSRARDDWTDAARTGQRIAAEYRLRRFDGDYRWHLCLANPLHNGDGDLFAWVGTCSDIEARQRAAAELNRANDARRQADHARRRVARQQDTLLAILAHELRNPMASLQSGLDLLEHATLDGGLAEARAMMRRQLSQLAHVTDAVLEVSQLTGDDAVLKFDQVDLNDVAAAAAAALQGAGVTIELRPDPARLTVQGDRIRLIQALTQLLEVCSRCLGDAGPIVLQTGVQPGADGQGCIRMAVSESHGSRADDHSSPGHDTGAGVDELESDPAKVVGMGMEFTLARQLLELHGGQVTAEPHPSGRGSAFLVTLPLTRSDPAAAEPPAPVEPVPGSQVILVVDDHSDTADALGTLLRLDGHTVSVAHDGVTALATLTTFPANLVLLDLGMPGMDGYQLARRIRALPDGHRFHLIAISGWGQPRDRDRARRAGIDEHITKPVDIVSLRRHLGRLPAE